jgi:transposase-like protein
MYLAGVSVRRVEDITKALWGTRVRSGTVSRLNQKIYRHIEAWGTRRIEGEFLYLYLDTGIATSSLMCPNTKVSEVARMLKAIHAQEDRSSALAKMQEVVTKLWAMRLPKSAELVAGRGHQTLTYFAFPSNHWRQLRTNNPLERIIREIRRRTRVVGAFPDGHSALMLVAARLRHIASTRWGKRRYLAMENCRISYGFADAPDLPPLI